jgi:A/G-specific adenine glycosylase
MTIPDDPDVVAGLPGFGRYTVGAVLSQAYDHRLPIMEANSRRVLCRLFGIDKNPSDSDVNRQLWQLAESLLPRTAVGDFNQAMMELGALVCTPALPKCDVCPIRQACLARKNNRQHAIPVRAKQAEIIALAEVAVVIRRAGRVLLVQRPDSGRWANLWEFPHGVWHEGESHAEAARRLLAELGIEGDLGSDSMTIRHSVTRFRITMTCLDVKHRRGTRVLNHANSAWVRPDALHDYPLSTPQRRLARHLLSRISGKTGADKLPA